jgi:hypothetical protein
MSSKNQTPKSMFSKVAAFLKLGDEGKLQSFYSRLQRTVEQDIKKLTTSRSLLVSNFQEVIEQYQYDIQDAVEAVDSAWMNVTPEQVSTNELQSSFMGQYLDGVSRAEAKVTALEDSRSRAEKSHASSLESIDAQIARFNTLLVRITGESSEA